MVSQDRGGQAEEKESGIEKVEMYNPFSVLQYKVAGIGDYYYQ